MAFLQSIVFEKIQRAICAIKRSLQCYLCPQKNNILPCSYACCANLKSFKLELAKLLDCNMITDYDGVCILNLVVRRKGKLKNIIEFYFFTIKRIALIKNKVHDLNDKYAS